MENLQTALHRTDEAIRAITAGESRRYVELWDDSPDITLFGAWGPIERGPDRAQGHVRVGQRTLRPRRRGDAGERRRRGGAGSLAYTVGFERGEVQIDGGPLVPMTIRVTHVYRYARGRWRLTHRHADFPPADQRT